MDKVSKLYLEFWQFVPAQLPSDVLMFERLHLEFSLISMILRAAALLLGILAFSQGFLWVLPL
ncbi:MAG: hypothetical protein GH158_02540 [Dehalococcoidia bacterium]|nr:hypothetical protein [Dehalococcoidia bacterium]